MVVVPFWGSWRPPFQKVLAVGTSKPPAVHLPNPSMKGHLAAEVFTEDFVYGDVPFCLSHQGNPRRPTPSNISSSPIHRVMSSVRRQKIAKDWFTAGQ